MEEGERFEPLTVVNKNPDEDIVVISERRVGQPTRNLIAQNKELSDKVCGAWQKSAGQVQLHEIEG